MTLRIDTMDHPRGATLRLAGCLGGPSAAELARQFDLLAGQGALIVIDLADVAFVASDGLEMLRDLVGRGAAVRGCPAYLVPQFYGAVLP
jgi:anti-anti-sigma regulatory factor